MKKYLFFVLGIYLSTNVNAQNFSKIIISNNQTAGIYGLWGKDLDNDGDIDLMSASQTDNSLAYYINDGNANFTQHILTGSSGIINLPGALSIDAADFDNDGDIDFVACGTSDLYWYENNGGVFIEHLIETGLNNPLQVRTYDVGTMTDPGTPDGDIDIGVLVSGENTATVYMNDGNNSFSRINLISVNNPKFLHGGDFDSDNTDDLVITSYTNNEIKWYKLGTWGFVTGGTIVSNFNGAFGVEGGDLDLDNDDDVVATAFLDNEIAWFENTDGTGNNFTKHSIDTNLIGASYVHWVDIDADGDKDFIVAAFGNMSGSTTTGHEMVIYYNDGSMNFTKFTADNTEAGPANFFPADFNNDGLLDIAYAANVSGKLVLLANNALSITEHSLKNIKIYPNPASTYIKVLTNDLIQQIEILDLTGRKILNTNSAYINLQNFQKGYYLMHISLSNGQKVFRKFLVK